MRVGKFALIKHQRYAHARQFKRARRSLRTLKTYLGRVIRDIERAILRQPSLNAVFRRQLYLAGRVLNQKRAGRGHKIYSLHAPEVECIGKGTAHKPYEFGVKISVATTLKRSSGGQFVLHAKALPGNPYDGHTLASVIPAIKKIMKRRAAIEPVIGHGKQDHRMGRNHLAHAAGDATNAVLAAAGYNFRRILPWLRLLLVWIACTLGASRPPQTCLI